MQLEPIITIDTREVILGVALRLAKSDPTINAAAITALVELAREIRLTGPSSANQMPLAGRLERKRTATKPASGGNGRDKAAGYDND